MGVFRSTSPQSIEAFVFPFVEGSLSSTDVAHSYSHMEMLSLKTLAPRMHKSKCNIARGADSSPKPASSLCLKVVYFVHVAYG